MIIAIDGPSGSGKSTISKLLSNKLNMEYIDTGAMYRAVAYYLIKNDLLLNEENIKEIEIDFKNNNVLLNGENVEKYIRTQEISSYASKVSADKNVREKLVKIQRDISKNKDIILDGRDIGTVVFPNADYKIYLNANSKCRAKRRFEEIKDKENVSFEEVLSQIERRDFADSTREISPLKKAEDAIEIDTSEMSIDEVLEEIIKIVKGNK